MIHLLAAVLWAYAGLGYTTFAAPRMQEEPAMPTIAALMEDSTRGLNLEESATFQGQTLAADETAEARRVVDESADYTRYHVLMALRRDWPDSYAAIPADARARVLVGALEHVTWLNDFGYLEPDGAWDGPAAQALIETGPAARGPLASVLGDARPAPLSGSEMATMSAMYGYRRSDFAYRYLSLSLGDDPAVFDADLAERDRRIAALRLRVDQLPPS